MKTNNLIKTGLFLAISSVLFTSAYADTSRHIYNNSNQPQTVTFSPSRGDIHFNSGCISQSGLSCTIAPGSTAEFVYVADGFDRCAGSLNFSVDGNSYNYQEGYISHDGTTGKFYALNDPTSGDIDFYNNS